MTEEEYKQEWLNGMHQTEYNACRFSNNKIQYCFSHEICYIKRKRKKLIWKIYSAEKM